LSLEGVDDIHSSDSLPLGVFSVCDGIPDDVLQENLENTSGFLVDETRNTLHTTTASQTTNGRLGDTLDIVTKNLAMTLSATLSEPLASFTATSHLEMRICDAQILLRCGGFSRLIYPSSSGLGHI